MSIRYSYSDFSTRCHGVIETGFSSHSDDYVVYEIENEIPTNYKCIAKTKKLSEYVKDPNHSISYGKNKQRLNRINQIKSQLNRGRIIRADNIIIKQTANGFFEIYQLRRGSKIPSTAKRKNNKPILNRREKREQSVNEIYNHLITIQKNAQRKRELKNHGDV